MPQFYVIKRTTLMGIFFLVILMAGLKNMTFAQMSVTGPSCALNGTQYSYTIAGNWTSGTRMSWSVTGGTISGSTSGTPLPQIHVTWNSGTGTGTISVSTSNPTYSPSLVVTIATTLTGGTLSNLTQNITTNTIPAPIMSATSVSGGYCSPNYNYQWQQSTNNVSFLNIAGATSQNLGFSAGLTQTMYYRRMVTEINSSSTAYSNTATIFVYPPVVAGSATPATQTINYNNNASALTVSGVSGGTNSYTYQWQSSINQSTFDNIGSATSSTYIPTALTTTTYYRVAVSSNGHTAYTNYVTVLVNPQLLPGIISPAYVNIISGTSPGVLNGIPATYGSCSGSYIYQWYSSVNGTTFTLISGAISQNYIPGNLNVNTWFTRRVSCSSVFAYTDTIQVIIVSGTPDINFVRVRDINKAGVFDSAAALALTSPYDVTQTTQYFDGLGRPIETVTMLQSPLQKDIVSFNVYDAFGREAVKYMPYVSSAIDGNYKPTAQADEARFNALQYPGEQYYYSQSVYEPSPLNRVINTYAPGNSWVGSSRGVNAQYLVNTVTDSVRLWNIAFKPGSIPTTAATYAAGTLYKNVTTDESGHSAVEYKDTDGKVILKKVQVAAITGTAHIGWLCTYYIYDDLNNLRFVIQPRGVELINNNWTITAVIANELCFRYEYDYRKRMIIKKIPGAGEAWMVYDLRDRLVMNQDSGLRFLHKWMFIKYDNQNRPDSTGLITDPTNYNKLSYHQNLAGSSINYPVVGAYTNELLTKNYYDDYNWVSGTGTGLNSSLATGYSTNATYFITGYNTSPNYSQPITPFNITRGMVTGTKSKVIGSPSQFLYTVSLYDDRGRIIQTQSVNYTGGIDTSLVQYSFNSKPLRSLLLHKKNGLNIQNHKILTKMSYDAGSRLLTIYKNIDNAGSDQLITTNIYNETGQLGNKALGNNLENLAYNYNVRGWLGSVNKNYLAGTSTNYFGMELGYDKTASIAGTTSFLTPQYNGNIEGTVWKSKGDGINRKYDFGYDNVNRLKSAGFLQNTTGSAWDKSYLDFSVNNLVYDANGNILTMNQKGFKINGSGLIDSLKYTYQATSNKLSKVDDFVNDPLSKLGDFHYTGTKQATDYNYDGNGNLILDNNKAISTITYNYLNLPNQVTVTSKGNITYTYDAAGSKLKKTTVEGAKTTTTLYMGGFVYQNDTLQFAGHEEGRVRWAFHKYLNGNTRYGWEYDFFLKDHLGNVRMVLTQQKDTAQYIATMEAAYRTTENALFYNIPKSSYPRNGVSGYPTDNTTVPNDSLARVNGNGQKTGPSLLLRVMSGDVVDVATKSFYKSGGTNITNNPVFNDVLNSLAGGIAGVTFGSHGTPTDLRTSSGPLYGALNSFISSNNPNPTGKPKAYLNWILLDDQFKSVPNYPQSGAVVVGGPNVINPLAYSGIPVTKNGYLYIWVSNETQGWDVFFDNLSVKQYSGPIMEETHYYPFGLTMAGISSKAVGSIVNRNKFNSGSELQSGEFIDGSGLETYDAVHRMYDAQLGRFGQIDPLSFLTSEVSCYTFALNNPIVRNDPTGLKDSLPEIVVANPQKLKGGSYNGLFFNSIKEITTGSGSLNKKVLTNNNALDYLLKEIETAKTYEEKLKLVGELGGGSIGVKSIKKLTDLVKLLKTGKLKPDPIMALSAIIYAEGMKYGMTAEDLQKVVNTYIELHRNNPEAQKGIYEITTMTYAPSSWNGSNIIMTSTFYDIYTKQYLGESTIR